MMRVQNSTSANHAVTIRLIAGYVLCVKKLLYENYIYFPVLSKL